MKWYTLEERIPQTGDICLFAFYDKNGEPIVNIGKANQERMFFQSDHVAILFNEVHGWIWISALGQFPVKKGCICCPDYLENIYRRMKKEVIKCGKCTKEINAYELTYNSLWICRSIEKKGIVSGMYLCFECNEKFSEILFQAELKEMAKFIEDNK